MKEKVYLVVEETNCDPKEAMLALEIAKYDVEKAIRLIGKVSNFIYVLKGKYFVPSKSLYGLLIIVFNLKEKLPMKISTVVSYNPIVCETNLSLNWYEFEKKLYTYRLWDGSLQTVTQHFEKILSSELISEKNRDFYIFLRQDKRGIKRLEQSLSDISCRQFENNKIILSLEREELNLNQCKYLQKSVDEQQVVSKNSIITLPENSFINIQIELIKDSEKGIRTDQLVPGDHVIALVTDGRDIAQYIAHLLGGRSRGVLLPITIAIESIKQNDDNLRIESRLAPGIIGWSETESQRKVKLVKSANPRSFIEKLRHLLKI